MIKHRPQFDVDKIIEHYEEKDGVPIKYVCTSDLKNSDMPLDIFYRDTPHPQFGNRYFGLFIHPVGSQLMITDADHVEKLTFGMVSEDDDLIYSQSHHECIFTKDGMIDGGRLYIRSSGPVRTFKVKDGQFIEFWPAEDSGVEAV